MLVFDWLPLQLHLLDGKDGGIGDVMSRLSVCFVQSIFRTHPTSACENGRNSA